LKKCLKRFQKWFQRNLYSFNYFCHILKFNLFNKLNFLLWQLYGKKNNAMFDIKAALRWNLNRANCTKPSLKYLPMRFFYIIWLSLHEVSFLLIIKVIKLFVLLFEQILVHKKSTFCHGSSFHVEKESCLEASWNILTNLLGASNFET